MRPGRCRCSAVHRAACRAAFMRTCRSESLHAAKGFWLEFFSLGTWAAAARTSLAGCHRPAGWRPEVLVPAMQLCCSHAHPRAYASHRSSRFAQRPHKTAPGAASLQAYEHGRGPCCAWLLQRASAARGRAPAQPALLLLARRNDRCAQWSRLRRCHQQMSRTPPGLRPLRPLPPRSPSPRAISHAYASADSCRMKPALGHAPARALRTSASASPSRRPSSCAQAGAGSGVAAPQRQHAGDKS